jgi:hypothetical protein
LGPGPAEQDRLRKLERAVESSGERKQLEATLASYGAWLQSRSPSEKLSLRDRDITTPERLERAGRMLEESQRTARRQLSPEDEKSLQDAILKLVDERHAELVEEVNRQGDPNRKRSIENVSVARLAMVILWREMSNVERRDQLQNRLTARLSPETQEYLNEMDPRQRMWQIGRWVSDAMAPKLSPKSLQRFFTDKLTNEQREYLLGLPQSEMEEQLQQMYLRSQIGLREEDFPRRFWRGGPDGRGPGERDRGPDERGPRDGRRRDFDRDGFDGPPPGPGGPRGPGGPFGPGGRPMGPPPRDRGRDWRPPPGGPPPDGPPPYGGPPPREMPARDEPI